MTGEFLQLDEAQNAAFRAAVVFLQKRLQERAAIEWALNISSNDLPKRFAIIELLNGREGGKLVEPWRGAWRLIEEYLQESRLPGHRNVSSFLVRERLRAHDNSGALATIIVEMVRPRLVIEQFSELRIRLQKPPTTPKDVEDLFSVRLTSGEVVDPVELGLPEVTDVGFLKTLVFKLDGVVAHGLEIAQRIWGKGTGRYWRLGGLHRVYFVPPAKRVPEEHEPDEFHRGIAPSVKLLHSAVSRLADLDMEAAKVVKLRWRAETSRVYKRLYAAISRDRQISPSVEVAEFLLSLRDKAYWDSSNYPEIAELRAVRFADMSTEHQVAIAKRLKRLPPRNLWPKSAKDEDVKVWRITQALAELRRIEIAGGVLRSDFKRWIADHSDSMPAMSRIDDGFIGTAKAQWVPPNPDQRFDALQGESRLSALEAAFLTPRGSWRDDPADRAQDWIRSDHKASELIADFEQSSDGGTAFPSVWNQFGWAHTAQNLSSSVSETLSDELHRVLRQIKRLSDATIANAIDGLTSWLQSWERHPVIRDDNFETWFRLWPFAVRATNGGQSSDGEFDLNQTGQRVGDGAPLDLDTFNTPAGKLVEVFVANCPNLQEVPRPFEIGSTLETVRRSIFEETGKVRLIAQHRLIQDLAYFLIADLAWSEEHLVKPLMSKTRQSLALWRAVARRTRHRDVMKYIGPEMAVRAVSDELDRETRKSLVFSLVVESLHAFRENRSPYVPHTNIQQMIRALDDEVRANAAESVYRYLRQLSARDEAGQSVHAVEDIFDRATRPFLKEVWPQEKSLTTPGVSRALAHLPAAAGERFAEAVELVERFLVPFECWSMSDYGFFDDVSDRASLSSINNHAKAEALLALLDLTIGKTERAVVPYDLSDALNQVEKTSPKLSETQTFRWLAAIARRT